ncbi:MAG: hypothetical protein K6E81_05730 [Lachnospiraceae bacterium]|nr:hypothetical protein [Lachnospiraceae bacterium]
MTSKISFKSLVLEDLRHRRWMLGFSLLAELIAGPVLLLFFITLHPADPYAQYDATVQAIVRFFHGAYPALLWTIAIAASVTSALFGFRFLFTKNMTDLYHSIPVRREKLFLSIYLDGLLTWLVPLLVCWIPTFVIGYSRAAGSRFPESAHTVAVSAWSTLAFTLLIFLIVYHLCLVGVVLSGNVLNCIFCIGFIGLVAVASWGLIVLLMEEFLSTFLLPSDSLDHILWLSPLGAPIALLYGYLNTSGSMLSPLGNLFDQFPVTLIGSTLLMLLGFGAALLLYRRRSSEEAEGGLSSKWVQSISRVWVSVLAGLLTTWIVNTIVGNGSDLFWDIFFCALVCILTIGILDSIFQRGFRAFFGHKRQMLLASVLAVGIFICFRYALLPYDSYLPKRSNILSAEIEPIVGLQESNYLWVEGPDGKMSRPDRASTVHLTDGDLIYRLLADGVEYADRYNRHTLFHKHTEADPDEDYLTNITITVHRRFGRDYQRYYRLSKSSLADIASIAESDAYRKLAYPTASGMRHDPEKVRLYSYDGSQKVLSDADAKAVMEAYRRDFAMHHSFQDLATTMSNAALNLQYPSALGGTIGATLEVPLSYEATMKVILSIDPDIMASWEDVDLFWPDVYIQSDGTDPKKSLYSYFGVPGYEEADAGLSEEAQRSGGERYYRCYGQSLMPALHPELYEGLLLCENIGWSLVDNDYIYMGRASLPNAHRNISVYGKKGEVPTELLDLLQMVPEDEVTDYGTIYEDGYYGPDGNYYVY